MVLRTIPVNLIMPWSITTVRAKTNIIIAIKAISCSGLLHCTAMFKTSDIQYPLFLYTLTKRIMLKQRCGFVAYANILYQNLDIDVNVGTSKEQRKGYIPAISEREKGI